MTQRQPRRSLESLRLQSPTSVAPSEDALQSLSLNIFITGSSAFATHHTTRKERSSPSLQILVYLNGTLAATHFLSQKATSATSKQLVRLTGTRFARLIEKPWLLASLTDRRQISVKHNAINRWNHIANGLLREIYRMRANGCRSSSPSRSCLESLVYLACPSEVHTMIAYACLDVLVVSGCRERYPEETRFSKGPERPTRSFLGLGDEEKPVDEGKIGAFNSTEASRPPVESDNVGVHESPHAAKTIPRKRHHSPESPLDDKRRQSLRLYMKPRKSGTEQSSSPQSQASLTPSSASNETGIPLTGGSRLVSSTNRSKRKSTAAPSSFSGLDSNAKPIPGSDPTEASDEPISLNGAEDAIMGQQEIKRSRRQQVPQTTQTTSTISSVGQENEETSMEASSLSTSPLGIAPRETGKADANFVRPPLSEGCVVGYAPEGIVRNVSATRAAQFEESEVVFVCRYIIT